MGLLIYAFLALLLSLAALKRQSRAFLLLLQLLPFQFVFVFLWLTKSDYQILQVQKLGYQFEKVSNDFRHPARSIIIGGNQQQDDLFYSELPAGAMSITPSLSDSTFDVQTPSPGVVVFRNGKPVNAVILKDGDRIQGGGQSLVFYSHGAFARGFRAGGKEWTWPKTAWTIRRVKEPSFAESFDAHPYLLSDVARKLGIPWQADAAVNLQKIRPTASRNPLQINSVFLVGGNGTLKINDQRFPTRFTFSDGDTITIDSIDATGEITRLKPVVGFLIKNSNTLNFFHLAPQTLGMKESLLRSGTAVNKPLLVATGSLPYSVFPTVHYSRESRKFDGLFAFVQTHEPPTVEDLAEQMKQRLLKLLSLEPRTFEVVTDQGTYRLSYGEQFALGRTDRIIFSLDRIQFPWLLLQSLFILFLLKIIFQPPFLDLIETRPAQLMLLNLDFFLTTRFLFAFRASSLYPFSRETVNLALLAVLLVPYLLFSAILCSRSRWERSHWFHFSAYTLLALVVCAILLPEQLWLIGGVAAASSIVAFLRFHPRSWLPRLKPWLQAARRVSPEAYLGAFLGSALVVELLGAGEAVALAGIRVPLPVLYHPVFLCFAVYYLQRLKERLLSEKRSEGLREIWILLVKLLVVMGAFFFLSYLMSDFGFFLLYCLPILLVLFGTAVQYVSEYELSWKAAGACMMAPAAVFFLLFSTFSTINRVLPSSYFNSRPLQRVLLAVDPAALEESGLITAERQLGHQRTFLAYAHSGLNGGGYMNHPVSSAISTTALNDNVPAVFLLNDFGIFGFAAVIVILLLLLWLWRRATSDRMPDYLQLLSLGALITIVFVDTYMILSNCGILLFTGKNVFLWGLNSTSDLLHSALLMSLMLVPVAGFAGANVPYPISYVGAVTEPGVPDA